jgi:hypothetical protein
VIGSRLRWVALLLSLGVLVVVWVVGPESPAIYDGLPIGTPPYRYLLPPKGSPHTPPPSSVVLDVVLAQAPGGITMATREPKPQADVSLPTQLLVVPAGVTVIRASVTPVLPPAVAPRDGTIDGNVYRISVTTLSGQPLVLQAGASRLFQVELLGTGSSREPHVEQYVDGGWVRVPFVHPESGIFQFHPPQPGEFALVLPPGHSIFGPGLTAALAIGGALVVLGSVLMVIRRQRLAKGYEDYEDGSPDATAGDAVVE